MSQSVTLDDKYVLESGRVYLTGTQALVRLPMMQRQRDLAAGLNTACYITGYRGSPLGGFDQALWQAKRFIKKNHIEFQPGTNEDLAATALWGTQQIHLYPGARYDGVFKPPARRSTSMHSASMPRCLTSASTRRGACALIQ